MKLIGKGTVHKMEIATVLTAVAQVISIDLPEQKHETFEADSLDNTAAGIPHQATGRTERGELGLELFFDPALAGHAEYTSWLDDATPEEKDVQVIFTSTPAKTWQFDNCPGCTLGAKIVLNDGVKATVKYKANKLLTVS
jgi:hypothetical protein